MGTLHTIQSMSGNPGLTLIQQHPSVDEYKHTPSQPTFAHSHVVSSSPSAIRLHPQPVDRPSFRVAPVRIVFRDQISLGSSCACTRLGASKQPGDFRPSCRASCVGEAWCECVCCLSATSVVCLACGHCSRGPSSLHCLAACPADFRVTLAGEVLPAGGRGARQAMRCDAGSETQRGVPGWPELSTTLRRACDNLDGTLYHAPRRSRARSLSPLSSPNVKSLVLQETPQARRASKQALAAVDDQVCAHFT